MGKGKLKPNTPRCTAKSKTSGNRCMRPTIPGGTVCRYHGGNTPVVRQRARERLLEAADPAAARLGEIVRDGRTATADQIRAAVAILDRSGYGPGQTLEITGAGGIAERLKRGRERAAAQVVEGKALPVPSET